MWIRSWFTVRRFSALYTGITGDRPLRTFNYTWKVGYLKNLEYQIVRPDGVIFDGEVSSGAIYDIKWETGIDGAHPEEYYREKGG